MVDYQKFGQVVSSDNRKAVVETLSKGPHVPKEIAEEHDMGSPHVTRTLNSLCEEGITKLLVDEDTQKGRVFGLTSEGEEIAETIAERENDG